MRTKKETIEKIIANNRRGFAVHQIWAMIDKLEQELATINAERAESRDTLKEMIKAQDEVAQLRAEVEELNEANRGLSKDNGTLALQVGSLHAKNTQLRAELDACREVKERVAELTDYVSSQPWSRVGAYSTRSAIEHMKDTDTALDVAEGAGKNLAAELCQWCPHEVRGPVLTQWDQALARIAALKDNSAKQ